MMVMNGMERISTPWRLRLHRFRYTTLPVLGLLAFAVLTFLLWTQQGEMPHAIGEIEAIRVDVAVAAGRDPEAPALPKDGGPSTIRSRRTRSWPSWTTGRCRPRWPPSCRNWTG